jgi:hypothetical protein
MAMLVAPASEALLIGLLGAPEPWRGAAGGALGGLALLAVFDLVSALVRIERTSPRRRLGRRFRSRKWLRRLAVAAATLLALPFLLQAYQRIALPDDPIRSGNRPRLTIVTGLPLFWDEADVIDTLGQPGHGNPTLAVLRTAFDLRAADAFSALANDPLVLVAQPRPPDAAALVALDSWVRAGGRLLILTDPALRWPSKWPHGDPRRPPLHDGLDPLIAHWSLKLEPLPSGPPAYHHIGRFRLMLADPGRLVANRPGCRIEAGGLIADCRIGSGRAILLADADLLHPLLWSGPGEIGPTRRGRTADNIAFVVHLLDRLSGEARPRAGDSVAWIHGSDSVARSISAALLAPILILSIGLALPGLGKATSSRKDSDRLIHSKEGRSKTEQ